MSKIKNNLKKLVSKLNDINIATDYDLLKQSELYERKYKIEFNESKIPIIMENKYVLVPSYNYKGDVKDTSILQEHFVGSKDYILSVGSPSKKLTLVNSRV